MKWIIKVVKKLVISICMLYTINIIIESSGILLPINYISIILVYFLGLPSIFGMLAVFYFI